MTRSVRELWRLAWRDIRRRKRAGKLQPGHCGDPEAEAILRARDDGSFRDFMEQTLRAMADRAGLPFVVLRKPFTLDDLRPSESHEDVTLVLS